MQRNRVPDLLTPPAEKIVNDGEEEREEDGVSEVQRESQSVGGLAVDGGGRCGLHLGGRWLRRSAAGVHNDIGVEGPKRRRRIRRWWPEKEMGRLRERERGRRRGEKDRERERWLVAIPDQKKPVAGLSLNGGANVKQYL